MLAGWAIAGGAVFLMTDLLRVSHLKKYFPIRGGVLLTTRGYVYAVDDVSFHLHKGETLGLVGESGCGKSTAARAVLRLVEPTDGEIHFEGLDIRRLDQTEMRAIRKEMQIIFQDPYASLNPRMTVSQIIGDPMDIHRVAQGRKKKERIAYLLESVGLKPEHMTRYPHEFSGGQRQRIGIARALATDPKLVIGDEPLSALDVSIQAQIINLLMDLQRDYNLTYLFIAHDLSVVKHISRRIGVMYLGRIVELTSSGELYENPLHPYTRALLSAVPVPDPSYKKQRIVLMGDVPNPAAVPPGCYFHPRCPEKIDDCKTVAPDLREVAEGHFVTCIRRY